jgi:cytochrome c oxidase subunit 4
MTGTRPLFIVWLALLVLLGLSVAGSFAFAGVTNLALSFGTAAVKAALILWFYMHLREEDGINRLFAVGATAWLIILIGLSTADFAAR